MSNYLASTDITLAIVKNYLDRGVDLQAYYDRADNEIIYLCAKKGVSKSDIPVDGNGRTTSFVLQNFGREAFYWHFLRDKENVVAQGDQEKYVFERDRAEKNMAHWDSEANLATITNQWEEGGGGSLDAVDTCTVISFQRA